MDEQGGFRWGAGASAPAVEGFAPASEEAAWVAAGRLRPVDPSPALADDGAEDAALLARLGLRALRVTVDWARVEPTPGRVDAVAVEDLRRRLIEARSAGLATWLCLHDGSLPGWFAHDERGFRDERSRRYHWARFVEVAGEHLGDQADGWIPVFEPTRYALRGWIDGARPPGQVDDAEGFAAMVEATLLATVEAARVLRGGGRPVASAHWIVPVFPARLGPGQPTDPAAEAAAGIVDEALWGCFARLLEEEVLAVPGRPAVDVPGARSAFDLLGITYRHAVAVRGDGALLPYPESLGRDDGTSRPWSEGLGIALHRTAERFPDRSLLLAGFGARTASEGEREAFAREALALIDEARHGGMDLRGAWWNTPYDPAGIAPADRPGLAGDDRVPRPAAEVLARAAAGDRPLPRVGG